MIKQSFIDRIEQGRVLEWREVGGRQGPAGWRPPVFVEMNETVVPGARRKFSLVAVEGVQYFKTLFYGFYIVLNVTVENVTSSFELKDSEFMLVKP